MLFEQIKSLVEKERSLKVQQGYMINLIKEYLQNIVLEYLYGNKELNNKLVFTGGTCLRFCFGLPRLSEDLDFDCADRLDHKIIANDLKTYFKENQGFLDLEVSLKGRDRKIYLKFPFLKELGLKYNDSFILLLKIEITQILLKDSVIEASMVEKNGQSYFLKRYSLPDLMAGKIHAFLTRLYFKGKENEVNFKGRDMYDLVWYMGKNVLPNEKRLAFLFKGTKYAKMTWPKMLGHIYIKAKKVPKNHLSLDLANFLENPANLENFLNNYLDIIGQYYEKYVKTSKGSSHD